MTEGCLQKNQTHKVRLSVQALSSSIDKLNPKTLVKIINTKTHEVKDAAKQKGALSKDERYVIHLQLYCQDYSNYLSNQFVKVVVADSEDKANGLFKGITAEDLLKKKEAQEQVKAALSNLLKFNVWLEGALRVTESGALLLESTQLNEY